MPEKKMGITVSIIDADQETTVRAVEVLARAMAGLALEGVNATLSVFDYSDDDDD